MSIQPRRCASRKAAMEAGLNLRERPISQFTSVTNVFRATDRSAAHDPTCAQRLIICIAARSQSPAERSSRPCESMNETFDFVVVGSGGGSMCAALLLRAAGKSVVILEKDRSRRRHDSDVRRRHVDSEQSLHEKRGHRRQRRESDELSRRGRGRACPDAPGASRARRATYVEEATEDARLPRQPGHQAAAHSFLARLLQSAWRIGSRPHRRFGAVRSETARRMASEAAPRLSAVAGQSG